MKSLMYLCLALSLVAIGCAEETTTDPEMMAGDTAGATPAGMTPAGATPAGATPAGEMAGTVTPVAGETPAGDMPAGMTPAGDMPAGMTPAGMTPGGEMSSGPTQAQQDCLGIIECINECAEGDQMCLPNCSGASGPAGQSLFNAVVTCFQDSISNGTCAQDDLACQNMTCQGELDACIGPPPTGEASCGEIIDCLNACPEGDMNCPRSCVETGTAEGQGLLFAIFECFEGTVANGQCAEDDLMCQNMACQGDLLACINSGPAPEPPAPGSLSCAEVFGCVQRCGQTDAQCQQACFNGVSAEESGALEAVLTCFEGPAAMCMDQACVEMACGAELQACTMP